MVDVQQFSPGRAGDVARLLREMEEFHGTPIADGTHVEGDVCKAARTMDVLVALRDNRVVGFAFSGVLYPTAGLVFVLHLKQLYVASSARRLGIGRMLLAHVARSARSLGCARMEWTTGAENGPARALYESMGATCAEKVKYVLQGRALDTLAPAKEFARLNHAQRHPGSCGSC